jgi:hypothetical protein
MERIMDRRFWLNIAAALLGGLALATVQASETEPQTFEQLDTDGNGYISRAEAQAGDPSLSELSHWGKYDTNKDGKIDKTEYSAYQAAHPPKTTAPAK